MRNVLQILRRDLKRLVTVPAAWVIMIGITIIPPLYAWFNIYGFWNPYGNTQGIKVAVANVDKGTDNALLGKMNLGDQIEDTLKDNDQLGWEFMGKAEAMEAVQSGDCYAAIIIPSNFSENLANVVTDSKNRPTLEYYVNEKSSPISPKITDQGATTVDRTVNNTFVSTVSEVLTKAVNSTNGTINGKTNSFVNETTAELDKTQTLEFYGTVTDGSNTPLPAASLTLVAPGGKAAELVLIPPQGGEKEDGTGHVPPDPAADLQPAHIRQHHVQQDQIRPGGGLLQSLPAAAGGGHLVSRPAEVAGQLVPQGFLIIHDQQSVRHCPSSPRSTG